VAPDQTLSDLFGAQVSRTPDAVAVTCDVWMWRFGLRLPM
jgi:non-ribosomal peptide synthetase component F